jgi:hypothetical protein
MNMPSEEYEPLFYKLRSVGLIHEHKNISKGK